MGFGEAEDKSPPGQPEFTEAAKAALPPWAENPSKGFVSFCCFSEVSSSVSLSFPEKKPRSATVILRETDLMLHEK